MLAINELSQHALSQPRILTYKGSLQQQRLPSIFCQIPIPVLSDLQLSRIFHGMI